LDGLHLAGRSALVAGRGEGSGVAAFPVIARAFLNLRVYVLAAEIADALYREVASWPSFEKWTLGSQLVRAADSIAANIAEAAGRWHAADKRRLLVIARGSLYETQHWLARAEARGLDTGRQDRHLEDVARMLSGMIRRPGP
jgi:four helix bundle protein